MSAMLRPDDDAGAGAPVEQAPTRAARRRLRFAKARAPVAIAMRVIAAAVATSDGGSPESVRDDAGGAGEAARASVFERSVRRSVFMRRVTLGLDAPFEFDAVFGTVGDKDLH